MRTRFAPSPTGLLHLGHAYSALLIQDFAQKTDMEFLLRLEDIDGARCRPEFEAAIFADLSWLGISWPDPVMRQSVRLAAYQDTLNQLISKGICYPCGCSRRDISLALSAPQEGAGAASGPDGPVYPGTCAHRRMEECSGNDAIRLNMGAALDLIGHAISGLEFVETGSGAALTYLLERKDLIENFGDIVLARRDIGTSYHLSVVVDDAAQGISHVLRGEDMFAATKIHRLLQELLKLPTPIYHHHRLIRDEKGKRLAKRDDARSIQKFRQDGASPRDIRDMLGL